MSTKENNTKVTPLMKQYNAIKREHPKTLLLFRVGDFYSDPEEIQKKIDAYVLEKQNKP